MTDIIPWTRRDAAVTPRPADRQAAVLYCCSPRFLPNRVYLSETAKPRALISHV